MANVSAGKELSYGHIKSLDCLACFEARCLGKSFTVTSQFAWRHLSLKSKFGLLSNLDLSFQCF